MLRVRTFLLVLTLFLTSVYIPSPTYAQETCPDSPPTRLAVGDLARVLSGSANNVRDEPSTSGTKVGEIPGEDIFEVWEGPVCAEGYTWYRVKYGDIDTELITGWTIETFGSEYAVEPYSLQMSTTVGYPRILLDAPTHFGDAQLDLHPLELDPHEPWYWNVPEWITLQFSDTNILIEIYPITGLEHLDRRGMSNANIESILGLDRPASELTKDDLFPLIRMPSITDIFTQVSYIDFENGRGVRYISYFTQDLTPIFPEFVTYTFLGYNDEYYVHAFIPVITDVLEENIEEDVTDDYDTYIIQANTVLNDAESTDFSIDLALLDAMFASMRLESGQPEPEIILTSLEVITDLADSTPSGEVGDCGLDSRLEVGGLARQALEQDSLRVRDATGAATGENVFPGDIVHVEGGPVCIEGRNWWQVSNTDGTWTGWIAEAGETDYFLEPIMPTRTATFTLTPTQTLTPRSTMSIRTSRPTQTAGPSPTPTLTSTTTLTPTLIAGRCRIIAIEDTRLRSYPNGTQEDNGFYAPRHVAIYADAQFNRPSEGFTWWRLQENAPVLSRNLSTVYATPEVSWVREDFVREEGNCDDLPEITP